MTAPPARLAPVAAAFVAFGTFLGTWAVVTADVERELGFSHASFGLLLALALAASTGANAAAGPLTERLGTSTTLGGALAIWAAGLGLLAVAPATWGLAVAAVLALTLGGAVDVAMNVASAAALADQPGLLVRFHGLFNLGAVLGAGATALVVHLGGSWRAPLVGIGAASVALAVWAARSHLPAGGAGEAHGPLDSLRTLRRERLGPLALIFACGAMVEGGIDTWGVLVLRDRLGITAAVGALGYAVGQVVATGTRMGLGPRIGRRGAVAGLLVGGGTAAIGLALLALAPTPMAVAGLAIAAGGTSVCWPLLLARAAEGRERPAAVVSGVTAIGYAGFVVGPPVIGGLAGLVGLRGALLFLAAAALVVAVGPRRLAPTPPATAA